MGREEFCITCRAADPDCELHYYDIVISVNDAGLVAAYNLSLGKADVFVPKKHKWAFGVNAKTLFKALEQWRKLA